MNVGELIKWLKKVEDPDNWTVTVRDLNNEDPILEICSIAFIPAADEVILEVAES